MPAANTLPRQSHSNTSNLHRPEAFLNKYRHRRIVSQRLPAQSKCTTDPLPVGRYHSSRDRKPLCLNAPLFYPPVRRHHQIKRKLTPFQSTTDSPTCRRGPPPAGGTAGPGWQHGAHHAHHSAEPPPPAHPHARACAWGRTRWPAHAGQRQAGRESHCATVRKCTTASRYCG
eukprot:1161141-Pelagomonas_calceolata.AAC.10